MSNTRAISAEIIEQVCYQHISLSEAFLIPELKPKDDDRAFVKEICFGTLRYWIQLQAILKELLETPLKKEDKDIECLLCVGLYQLIYMHVPHYALVNETVTATRILKKSWASGLVNKILRMAISAQSPERQRAESVITKSITAQYSHPNWIIDKIKSAWPTHWENILNANNQKAPLFLRVNQTKIPFKEYLKILNDHKINHTCVTGLSHGIQLENPMPVENIPGFKNGLFSVQDASGQKVVAYCDIHPEHHVLDACAAPGSKTTHILETCPSVKKLIALDLHKKRLSKVAENIKRLQLPTENVQLIAANACDVNDWWDGELFDRILLDAPCSASGVIRRHPDIKLLRKKTDIKNLAEQQLKMLETLWPLLKKSGKLIYSTCSIFPDENENVIAKFLSSHPDANTSPINNPWGENLKYGQQVITGTQNRDGFYYCVIQK
ncbi:MAG: 16S rRNA (cytosine(967)-C(5))-methyltransferase RsmB [Gammaproteobacteria bacterium]|nr:16S rRNA (cytosine(967)-C(5))-methyltransferase RsmB [Gammaproteobacteria bacterium]